MKKLNKSLTTTGERISDATIKRRYSEALKKKHAGRPDFKPCQCRGRNCQGQAIHNDHTVARARLKEIGKADLIYSLDQYAFVDSCDNCHLEWEAYGDGGFLHHVNHEERLEYLRLIDPDGAKVRDANTPLLTQTK